MFYKKRLKQWQKICAVVKADAYGLGSKKICKILNDDADYFAVSSYREFFEIKNIVTKPILVLDPIYENITKATSFGAELCVSNSSQINKIINLAYLYKTMIFKIHIAINTGMNRFGFLKLDDVINVIEKLQKTQNIKICGIFSHFFDVDNQNFADNQIKKFNFIKKQLIQKYNLRDVIFHISNTAGSSFDNEFDMVRIGIGIYLSNSNKAICLKSKIIQINVLKAGDCAGYNEAFIATKKTKIAVVAIGYADGLFRNITNKGVVLVNGIKCRIVAICMDCIIINIDGVDAKINDDVVLIGRQGKNEIFVCDIAKWCDTISYEIIARLSKRIQRKYINADNNRKV